MHSWTLKIGQSILTMWEGIWPRKWYGSVPVSSRGLCVWVPKTECKNGPTLTGTKFLKGDPYGCRIWKKGTFKGNFCDTFDLIITERFSCVLEFIVFGLYFYILKYGAENELFKFLLSEYRKKNYSSLNILKSM